MATAKKGRANAAKPSRTKPKGAPPKRIAAIGPVEKSAARKPEGTSAFPVVGLGASAGGLAAFEAFFSGMPTDVDPGMAFVLVQHLAPDHKSILTDLIRHYTRMEVFEVEDGMRVRANCAYIIPPGRDMALLNGSLQLLEPLAPRGQRLPIDFFFRSLAQDQRERAIGVVLSGTGSDGSLGVREIKGEGGLVLAQQLDTTEFDGMPRNAIATGVVDLELPPAEMPAQIIAYAQRAFANGASVSMSRAAWSETTVKKVFVLLRAQTGHDFSQYKPSTIHRRIERRMAVHQIERIDSYVKYLQQTPSEVEALLYDLLIGVTGFFRDSEAFEALEKVVPRLFENKRDGDPVRVWSAGCSTGEEAYSIAILLQEHQDARKQSAPIQVFATDVDGRAIAVARAGLYPPSIAADLSPERLARFFTAEPDRSGYRVHRRIRDLLVFSEQDVIKDPPFSKVDLLSCRNVMIYMGAELQKRLIPVFHYALNPDGVLMLGTSETIGDYPDLFSSIDRKSKLYRRKLSGRAVHHPVTGRFDGPVTRVGGALLPPGGRRGYPVRVPLRELTERALLQQVAPAGILVNSDGDILYLHGRTGLFLEPAPGEARTTNILSMAREGLGRPLAKSLRKASSSNEVVSVPGLRVRTNGAFTLVNLSVRPVSSHSSEAPGTPLFLVVLEEAPALAAGEGASAPEGTSPRGGSATLHRRIEALTLELKAREDDIRNSQEEIDSSTEELKSSNEEMQSMNEELRSANEELETSKEELQSVNEELSTVNAELHAKVADLSQANNDMNNMLAGTGIGTVFVDHDLRILRFTPAAAAIINLIPSDVGRPVAHIVSNMVGYSGLSVDGKAVLDTLVPKEIEVSTSDGRRHTMRILPYRTTDNVIEGAVITFVDITDSVAMREALREAREVSRLAVVVRDASDAITVQDLNGQILAWNPAAQRIYGWTEAEALAMNVRDRIPESERVHALERLKQIASGDTLAHYDGVRLTKGGEVIRVSITSTALRGANGNIYATATTERAPAGPFDNRGAGTT